MFSTVGVTVAAKGYFDALVKLGELASDSQGSKELGEWDGLKKNPFFLWGGGVGWGRVEVTAAEWFQTESGSISHFTHGMCRRRRERKTSEGMRK